MMANFSLYLFIFILGTFKYMFSAVPGVVAGVPFFNNFITLTIGGLVSFNFFYFMYSKLIKNALKKKKIKIEAGTYVPKKVFTKKNKIITIVKRSKLGFWAITIIGPMVLSIPLGAIIIAKFYRHRKLAYWNTTFSIILFGAIFTFITELFKG